jgi:hypothetical protein
VEGLEGRLLADAKVPFAVPTSLGNFAVARTLVNQNPQVITDITPATQLKTASASAGFQYTAFTIVNNSTATVAYSIKWGNGNWTSYALAAHQSRTHYIAALNQSATISYDKSFAPGYQDQEYHLSGTNITFPTGFYLVQPTPSVGAGHHYTFGNVPGGVQMYS